ncbi:hypothetical protein [Blattabacterium cuenoti]|uniref:hypothetical protein n=1 Tax=Blattabacterium cuenoti TaxID=1653831 RepID=UPI001EEB542E|nr:hypothetical protein [Blattabacterium cuenoti]
MYFSVSSFYLLQKLNFLSKIINTKNYSGYFTFKILEKTLIILISDLENNIITTKVKICVKKYSKEKINIPIKLIIQLLKTFPKKTIISIKKKKIY